MNSNIITVSGDPGSGKTSTINSLKKLLEQEGKKVEVYSTGAIFRELAKEEKMTVTDFNQFLEKQNCNIDAEIDQAVKNLGRKIKEQGDKSKIYIIDSRLAWHNIPESFKIRLTVSDEIAGKRIFFDKTRGEEDKYSTLEEAIQETKKRKFSEKERYMKQYKGVNISDYSNFDINIDTSLVTPDEVAECIIKCIEKMKSKDYVPPKRWTSPKSFLPTQSIRDMNENKIDTIIKSMKDVGYDSDFPIHAVQVDNRTFMVDGHHRCVSAARNNISLIPCKIIGKDDEQYLYISNKTVREFINGYIKYFYPTVLYDFEDVFFGTYRYTEIYPGIYDIKTSIVEDKEH